MRLKGRYDLTSYTGFLRCKYGYYYNYLDINEDFDICEYHYRKRNRISSGELSDAVKEGLHELKSTHYTHMGLRGLNEEELQARLNSTSGKSSRLPRAKYLKMLLDESEN